MAELPPGYEEPNLIDFSSPEVEYFAVDLPKASQGLGITIAGYVGDQGTGNEILFPKKKNIDFRIYVLCW